MQALFIDKIGHTEFGDVQAQDLGQDQVLLDVHHVGLCGSDLNTFRGLNPLVELPRIPGHEIGGVIAEVGSDVDPKYEIGQKAIVIPYTTCGQCPACLNGRVNACQFNQTLGVQQDGALRKQIVLKADRLILNDTLPTTHLALVEPLSVGFHAVSRGRVTNQDIVLVLGGGMIGVGAILGAKARGAKVIVSEVSDSKIKILKSLGVDAVINPDKTDLMTDVNALTQGRGADVIIEAVGLPETFRKAIDLAPYSGRVVYVGYAKSEVSYDTKFFNLKELDILGSRNATQQDFEAVITYLELHKDVGDNFISKIFPWKEADQAFGYWLDHRDETFKIMIEMDVTL